MFAGRVSLQKSNLGGGNFAETPRRAFGISIILISAITAQLANRASNACANTGNDHSNVGVR